MTDPQEKAMRMALKSLNWYVQEDDVIESMAGNEPWVEGKRNAEKAIQTLRQALAQPPVDWEAVAADQAMTIAMMKVEKREWVELTDEQIFEHEWWDEETAFAVNKELKEKNT